MKSTVKLTVFVDIEHPEDVDPEEVLMNMDYNFTASPSDAPAEVVETEITDWEINDYYNKED